MPFHCLLTTIVSDEKPRVMQIVVLLYVMCCFSLAFSKFSLISDLQQFVYNMTGWNFLHTPIWRSLSLLNQYTLCLSSNLKGFQSIASDSSSNIYSDSSSPCFPLSGIPVICILYLFIFSNKSLMHFSLKKKKIFSYPSDWKICIDIYSNSLFPLSFPFCN